MPLPRSANHPIDMTLVAEAPMRTIEGARFNFLEGGRKFSCKMIEPGIVSYKDTPSKDVILLRKETIDRCMDSAIGNAVTVGHVFDLESAVPEALSHGTVSKWRYNADDGWYYVDGEFSTDSAAARVEGGGRPSCGYAELEVRLNTSGDKYHGFHYDKEITEIRFHHLAVVPKGRYEEATFRLNSIPSMNMFKFVRTWKERLNGATTDTEKSETVEISGDTEVVLPDGTKSRLNELKPAVAVVSAPVKFAAIGDIAEVSMSPAEMEGFITASRKAAHQARLNAAEEAKKGVIAPVVAATAPVVTETEEAKVARLNAAGAAAFASLNTARFKDPVLTEPVAGGYSTSSGSMADKLAIGAKRY